MFRLISKNIKKTNFNSLLKSTNNRLYHMASKGEQGLPDYIADPAAWPVAYIIGSFSVFAAGWTVYVMTTDPEYKMLAKRKSHETIQPPLWWFRQQWWFLDKETNNGFVEHPELTEKEWNNSSETWGRTAGAYTHLSNDNERTVASVLGHSVSSDEDEDED